MNIRRTEDYFHTPEQLSLAVTQAGAILADHELSDEDNTALLPVLVQLLAAKNITYEQVLPAGMVIPGNERN